MAAIADSEPRPADTVDTAMLDDQDEDVRIAVRALGDMRNGSGSGGSGTDSRTLFSQSRS